MTKSIVATAMLAFLAVGCGQSADRFVHTTDDRLPAIGVAAVRDHDTPPPGFVKTGEIAVSRSDPRGPELARQAARMVVKRLAAENGASDVVYVNEDLEGQSGGPASASIRANAGTAP